MLLAGRDTVRPFHVSLDHNRVTITQTASVLSFLVYFLALHPEVVEKLRAEILLAYGSDGRPSVDDMKGLKYCIQHISCYITANADLSRSSVHAVITRLCASFRPRR